MVVGGYKQEVLFICSLAFLCVLISLCRTICDYIYIHIHTLYSTQLIRSNEINCILFVQPHDITLDHFKCLAFQRIPGCRLRNSNYHTEDTTLVFYKDCKSRKYLNKNNKIWTLDNLSTTLNTIFNTLSKNWKKYNKKLNRQTPSVLFNQTYLDIKFKMYIKTNNSMKILINNLRKNW